MLITRVLAVKERERPMIVLDLPSPVQLWPGSIPRQELRLVGGRMDDVRQLHMYDVLRADRCIAAHSMEARVPFGDLELVRYIMALDPEKKRNVYGKGKYLLRQAFVGGLLPESIRLREKAAFSDAVGHSLVEDLKALAEQMYGNEWKTMTAQYDFAMPFTKESLLYRQIFEKYYPGQAPMVAGFWMPNTSWQGCDVGDPSSRYLSNYGDSSR